MLLLNLVYSWLANLEHEPTSSQINSLLLFIQCWNFYCNNLVLLHQNNENKVSSLKLLEKWCPFVSEIWKHGSVLGGILCTTELVLAFLGPGGKAYAGRKPEEALTSCSCHPLVYVITEFQEGRVRFVWTKQAFEEFSYATFFCSRSHVALSPNHM